MYLGKIPGAGGGLDRLHEPIIAEQLLGFGLVWHIALVALFSIQLLDYAFCEFVTYLFHLGNFSSGHIAQ